LLGYACLVMLAGLCLLGYACFISDSIRSRAFNL
jgi:hypothetical protein